MNPAEYVPSPRARIYNLVENYSRRTGSPISKTWAKLYEAFEYRTNTNWRKLAYNNGMSPLEAIHSLRKMDELLELAREMLGQATPAEPTGVLR